MNKDDLYSNLESCPSLYILPTDPAIKEVLIPALSNSDSCDCMIGFFSSQSFREIAPGLASFINNTDSTLRLIISPFLSQEDVVAIENGLNSTNRVLESIFNIDKISSDLIVEHTLECLSWLINKNRLDIKVALMKDALMHTKAWIFESNEYKVALHGSMNFTNNAFKKNREQLTLSRSWKSQESIDHIKRLEQEFHTLWTNSDDSCLVVDLPSAVKEKILNEYKRHQAPSESDLRDIWDKAVTVEETSVQYDIPQKLIIPDYINYQTGDYKHQGIAINKWVEANYKGILQMATGSGKTITSLIAAAKLMKRKGPLLVVISAPYIPLIKQWEDEVKEFSVSPHNLTEISGPDKREKVVKNAIRNLKHGVSEVEILIVSNVTLSTERFQNSLDFGNVNKLLIADECHNLGSSSFIDAPPNSFSYKLGLSATPIRQYDEEGTEELFKYLGDVVFKYDLDEAIGTCLTQYDYRIHFVELTAKEIDTWNELTTKINSQSWKFASDSDDPYLNSLLRKRRLVLETASEKTLVLKEILSKCNKSELDYTLIYATDKEPEQLNQVNKILLQNDIPFHQLTSSETKDKKKTKDIIDSFRDKKIRVLSAKRVLDEGVNIPEIKRAYILASTTVKRQWVQRRGRLLRKCKEINKSHSIIHDFVAVPPIYNNDTLLDEDLRKLVRSELDRVWEFARLSRNGPEKGGPYEKIEYLQKLANQLEQ